MQLITNLYKYVLLAVLSCSLVIMTMWQTDNRYASQEGLLPITQDIVPYAQPVPNDAGTIWSSMRQDFKLNDQAQSAQVQAEIHKLLADQGKLNAILKAAAPYIYFIHQQTEARGLPAELALIPVIESEFNPNDHSKKGATGLWQLMPETAHELGIKVKGSYDGRRDVIASTNAALAYFNDLGNDFKGDWYLAIAAYNCGQGKIESVERRTGSHNFWTLPLPRETKYYVPKLLAVAAIIKNPGKYGVQLPTVTNKPYFTEVQAKKPVTLNKVAKTSGISIKTLNTLNPDYNHGSAPAKKGSYTVLVPVNNASSVNAQLATNKSAPAPAAKTTTRNYVIANNVTVAKTAVKTAASTTVAHNTKPAAHHKTVKHTAKRHVSYRHHHTRHAINF